MAVDGDSQENEDDTESVDSFLVIVLFTCYDLTIETVNFVILWLHFVEFDSVDFKESTQGGWLSEQDVHS